MSDSITRRWQASLIDGSLSIMNVGRSKRGRADVPGPRAPLPAP
jgi:hypothetical protein